MDTVSPVWTNVPGSLDTENPCSSIPEFSRSSEIFFEESSRDIELLETARVIGAVSSSVAVNNLWDIMMMDAKTNTIARTALNSSTSKSHMACAEKRRLLPSKKNSVQIIGSSVRYFQGFFKMSGISKLSPHDFDAFNPVSSMYSFHDSNSDSSSISAKNIHRGSKPVINPMNASRKHLVDANTYSRNIQNLTDDLTKKLPNNGKSLRRVRFDIPSDGKGTEDSTPYPEDSTPYPEDTTRYSEDSTL